MEMKVANKAGISVPELQVVYTAGIFQTSSLCFKKNTFD